MSSDKSEAEEGIKETYREARAVLNLLKNEHGSREKAQIIISKFPEEVIFHFLVHVHTFFLGFLKPYAFHLIDWYDNSDIDHLLCRLTPPICLNFLGMIHLDSHITMVKDIGVETQFTKLMGHLDVIPILAKGINIYLPMCILIFCAVTYYKLGTYLLHNLGFDQFVVSDEFTQDMVTAGRALVQLERSSYKRHKERIRRDEEWHGRLGALRSGRRHVPEDEQPIISAEEGNSEYDSWVLPPPVDRDSTDRSRKPHPSPSNIFDDM
ncbi:hypothetical protein ANCDUO_18079 [Ancylostoma duodenale]|uniref:Uncharacterized protein n=1 Tax=Ancylostoma duodenale TaxID=51022 RepID=A0A0C2CPW6_9BILA|nr:hypothetical protein ANCDUO_18079 [Ancylostoma duodenale]